MDQVRMCVGGAVLTQAEECGLYSLGMDRKPSKILEQKSDIAMPQKDKRGHTVYDGCAGTGRG